MADPEMDSDSDPVTRAYDVFIKPKISSDRQIFVLQFPNRDSQQPYNNNNHSQPLKLRTKPNSGMVEIDVPIDAWRNYDRAKGISWGDALKKSNISKGRGSHGLAGGFGIGGAGPGRGRGRGAIIDEDTVVQNALADYAGAMEREQVLTKQTLGGQCVPQDDTNPWYMVGTFRGDQLHLTPVDQIVQMRPQFHHVDAKEEERKAKVPREAPARPQEARAVHMSVKSTIDGEEDHTESMVERIAATQAEAWKSHRFVDENQDEAWETFGESLFVGGDKQASTTVELRKQYPTLVTSISDSEYLDAISVPIDAERMMRNQKRDKKGKGKLVEEDGESSATEMEGDNS
ncbi:DNA-directed RNA polymerase III subunit Rpc5 [Tricladium varicosporioides]|nr:DNA-directed RNA polymerase III subunit Rpc5 [Hymenoscyphus varicosporioides]